MKWKFIEQNKKNEQWWYYEWTFHYYCFCFRCLLDSDCFLATHDQFSTQWYSKTFMISVGGLSASDHVVDWNEWVSLSCLSIRTWSRNALTFQVSDLYHTCECGRHHPRISEFLPAVLLDGVTPQQINGTFGFWLLSDCSAVPSMSSGSTSSDLFCFIIVLFEWCPQSNPTLKKSNLCTSPGNPSGYTEYIYTCSQLHISM